MTLTTENKFVPFADYYNSLIAQEPTEAQQFVRLLREEVGVRRRIEKDEQRHFADVLHVAGVFIGDKKQRMGIGKRAAQHTSIDSASDPFAADSSSMPAASSRISMPPASRRALAVRAVEEAVWFPAAEPLPVTPPTRVLVPGYPYQAAQELFNEEAELRRWLHGVEARLRQEMNEACHYDLFVSMRLREVETLERRGRSRIERDQVETFSSMRNQVFYLAPPEYFRALVVRRFGASTSADGEGQARELTFWEQEARAREAITAAEQATFEGLFDYLQHAYDLQLFSTNHTEFVQREVIVNEEVDDLYPLMIASARGTYGLLYEHCPAVFVNMSTARTVAPLMHDLVMRFKTTVEKREAAARETLHSSTRVQFDVCEAKTLEEQPQERSEGPDVSVDLEGAEETGATAVEEDAPNAAPVITTEDTDQLEVSAPPIELAATQTPRACSAKPVYLAVEEDLDEYDEL